MSTALVRGRKFGQEFTSEELLLLIKQQQKKKRNLDERQVDTFGKESEL